MTNDPFAGRQIRAPERRRMLVATEDGVFLWPGTALAYRRGNGFFAMDQREVNSLVCSFFGPAAIDAPILTVLEIARDQLHEGRIVAVQRMLDRLPLPPLSPNGLRLMRTIATRQGLAPPHVVAATEQTGTVWDDRDIEIVAILHDDLRPQAHALEKAFNPGSAWDPAKHPRWPGGESDGGQFRPGDGGGNGRSSPIRPVADTTAQPLPKTWEQYPNAAMRQKLAELEHSAEKPNNGYGEKSKDSSALGRYQFLKKALVDAGWKNADGTWSDKAKEAGVSSDEDFLKNPRAQEQALTDVMQRNTKQLKANGAYHKIGQAVKDSSGKRLFVTEAGLIAAAHKEGAEAVAWYLDPKRRADLTPGQIRNIERRLRAAGSVPYHTPATARQSKTSRPSHNAQKK